MKKSRHYKMHKNEKYISEFISEILAFIFIAIVISRGSSQKMNIDANAKNMVLGITIIVFLLCFGRTALKAIRVFVRRKKYLSSSISQIDKMDGKEFEKYLKAYFEEQGYEVHLTKSTGDFGADLVMYKKAEFRDKKLIPPEKIIVQAKRYKKAVGIEAIQQVVAAKGHYKADTCAVATNQYFTKAAKELAHDNNVILWDRNYFWGIKKVV